MRIKGKIDLFYKQAKLNICYLIKSATIWTTSVIAAFELIGFLCDFNEIFSDDVAFLTRLFVSFISVAALWIIMLIIRCLSLFAQDKLCVIDVDDRHHVYVEYGDLFAESDESKNIVVTANRCFDTIVDDDLIRKDSIHGLAVNRICTNGYTHTALNAALQSNLENIQKIKPMQVLTRDEKRSGNLERYPAGSIAEFKKTPDSNTTYFFVGMSALDSDLKAKTTDAEYVLTVQALIEYCRSRSQGLPIYMPIIGTNGRDNGKSNRELLEYMVNTLRFHKHLINADIHIVVYSDERNPISIYGL